MSIRVSVTWRSFSGKPTIHTALRDKLGREPTNEELRADVLRILDESEAERASAGQLRRQRRWEYRIPAADAAQHRRR